MMKRSGDSSFSFWWIYGRGDWHYYVNQFWLVLNSWRGSFLPNPPGSAFTMFFNWAISSASQSLSSVQVRSGSRFNLKMHIYTFSSTKMKTHPRVIRKHQNCHFLVKDKKRHLEKCSCCSFSFNESEYLGCQAP